MKQRRPIKHPSPVKPRAYSPDELLDLGRRLIVAGKEINEARDELRKIAKQIFGGELGGWPFADIEKYIDLAIIHYRREIDRQQNRDCAEDGSHVHGYEP